MKLSEGVLEFLVAFARSEKSNLIRTTDEFASTDAIGLREHENHLRVSFARRAVTRWFAALPLHDRHRAHGEFER
ncbi:unnamed protein product [marine sediment metagenome]|uniref:Uncharacterized protein n=1 Tax=marine sediment metagenome TaxID=412755 RepID=X0WMD5_9ZZZZ